MSNKPSRSEVNKLANHPLQTWEWGEFRKKWGNEIVYSDFGLITVHTIPFIKKKIATFIRGPKPTPKMLNYLQRFSKKRGVVFVKLEPNAIIDSKRPIKYKKSTRAKEEKLLKKKGCVPGKTLFTPTSFWIDLTKSEKKLLAGFKSKTRYNIRYAKRKGVRIVENNSDEAFDRYISLMRETVERQGFYAHSESYHRLMWQYLHTNLKNKNKKPIARLLTATYKGKIITCWIVFVWKDFIYYPYGASTFENKNVQANSLMMWEAIKYGKKNKLKTFDLWGREPGKGFTRFKEGFKPNVVTFLGTWDLVTNNLYWPYRAANTLRWKFLKLRPFFQKPRF